LFIVVIVISFILIIVKQIHLHVYTWVLHKFLEPSPFFFTSNQGIYDSVEADKEPLPGHWEEFLGVFEWAFRGVITSTSETIHQGRYERTCL